MTETIIFYVFAVLAVICAIGVVAFRNPVTSAMNMALCFGCTAAILFGMGAQFLGIVQIIVYAGAILVLFLFVVMMLDLKTEENSNFLANISGVAIAAVFAAMVTSVAVHLPGACLCCCKAEPAKQVQQGALGGELPKLCPAAAARQLDPQADVTKADSMPDIKLLGQCLYTKHTIAFAILSFALLAGSVGAVAISRKIRKD